MSYPSESALQKLKYALTDPEGAKQRLKPQHRNRSLLERCVRFVYQKALRALPETRTGDKLFTFIHFIVTHKRMPSKAARFNDVLYRIKTSDEILDPVRVFVSDKEFVKLYVKAIVGDQYNVPTSGVIRSRDAVDTYEFPEQCCIKPTQASGPIILRRNGEPVDREKIKRWFDINYYRTGREANYKFLKPKAIVEPLIFGATNVEDYKFFCVNGVPKLIQVDVDRHVDHRRKYFDACWQELDFSIIYPKSEKRLPRPDNLDEMLRLARELSRDFSFVRVDLYSNGKECLVGEITHCAECLEAKFIPVQAEKTVSDFLFR